MPTWAGIGLGWTPSWAVGVPSPAPPPAPCRPHVAGSLPIPEVQPWHRLVSGVSGIQPLTVGTQHPEELGFKEGLLQLHPAQPLGKGSWAGEQETPHAQLLGRRV